VTILQGLSNRNVLDEYMISTASGCLHRISICRWRNDAVHTFYDMYIVKTTCSKRQADRLSEV
jgi:hypothetical protein